MRTYIRCLLITAIILTLSFLTLPASSAKSESLKSEASENPTSELYSSLAKRFLMVNFAALDEGFTDLIVTKTVSSDTVAPGSNVTYTIQLANAGPDSAANAVLNDPLPAG